MKGTKFRVFYNFTPGFERERGRGNGSFPVVEVLKPQGVRERIIVYNERCESPGGGSNYKNMKRKIILILSLFLVLVLVFFAFEYWYKPHKVSAPLQKIEEQKPGNSFLQIKNITLGQKIESPVLIKGEVRGVWFFEASFPIEIQDNAGIILGQGIAQTGSDWMTENFVPFSALLEFQKGDKKTGKIVFKKDNPSGDPARDDSFSLPVSF